MSNRTYTIVLSLAVAALVAVLGASYFLHRLTFSPVALFLLILLIGVPAATILRLGPWMHVSILSPQLREMMRERRDRDRVPAYAVTTCWLLLAASFVIMIAGPLLMPPDPESNTTAVFVMLWFGFFVFGWLGLIFTSKWVQTHGVTIAFAAIPVIGLSAVLLLGLGAYPGLLSRLFFAPLGLALYGVFMIITPFNVSFLRMFGMID
jgi:hypothetical protein